ncbi:pyridoxal phosphate-dependent transferase [Chaetomium tenue]|uniref:Pyridoxal phosphate-dependent transferase n=1 Tax=Chaetomium tenue TaxID=1854479 RepID=A0ACB7PMI2_9PEZI|nr:pyridoxal phosphate-dependent transferase [Chaetomium globosum]
MTSNPDLSPNHQAAQAALSAAEARFIANNPLSKAQHDLAIGTLPGGNTRTLLHTSPFPLAMKQGKDSYVWDVDNHKYVDLVGELTAGLLGHSHPAIHATIQHTLTTTGLSLGATTAHEHAYAALLCARFHLDRVRMANSGTEANLHALAGARHHTGRRKVVVFSGGYHGAVLGFGEGTPGVNAVDREDFVVVPRYNDLGLARRVIGGVEGLAAVLVEAVQGAGGCIVGGREFLVGVREAAREKGAVFILDEVMTSRLAPGGLAGEMGLEPDMVTLGKYLGGGLAFGAFGGREEVMRVYDPRVPGSLPHSGTFNNNTLVMSVGKTALGEVYTPEVCVEFNEKADGFRERLKGVAKGSRLSFTGKGSLIGFHFTEDGTENITCGEDVKGKTRQDLKDLFWFEMLEAGFWVTRRGLIALILGTPEEDLDQFVEAVKAFLGRHKAIMML